MIDRRGRVKVADFGLARLDTPDTEDWGHTRTGTVMGTLHYMAPEQTWGMKVDQRADIYSLGVMLYEMLCGKVPKGAFDPPSQRIGCDPRLDAVVIKAMQEEPERRYQTAREMKADVEALRLPVAEIPSPIEKPTPQSPSSVPPPVREKPSRVKRRGPLFVGAAIVLLAAAIITGVIYQQKARPGGSAQSAANEKVSPVSATREQPFVNTLGMRFVPVPITGGPSGGQRVLFSMWETRVQDYEAFTKATGGIWPKPPFPQEPTHPAVSVSWDDAQAFCAWLSKHERSAGRLGAAESYRLPTDHEWSCAVGIGGREDPEKVPAVKSGKLMGEYPWGTVLPPPPGSGNLSGEEAAGPQGPNGQYIVSNYRDHFRETSPVGSFAANRFGLYDLSGNVWEWCEDWFKPAAPTRVLRGAAYDGWGLGGLLSSGRHSGLPGSRGASLGFRVVLANSQSSTPPTATPRVSSTPAPTRISPTFTPSPPAITTSTAAPPGTNAAAGKEKWVDARQDANFKGNAMLRPTANGWIVQAQGRRLFAAGPGRDGAVRIRAPFNAQENHNIVILARSNHSPDNRFQAFVLSSGDEISLNRWATGKVVRALTEKGAVVKRKLPVPLKQGEEYELEVRVVGDLFTVKLQGIVLLESRDATLPEGSFGISLGEQGVEVPVKSIEYLDLSGSAPAAAASGSDAAGDVFLPYQGHRYLFVADDVSWAEAKQKAEAMGGYLAKAGAEEEMAQIIEYVTKRFQAEVGQIDKATAARKLQWGQRCWLGASAAQPGAWKWVTGQGGAIIPWSPGEPHSRPEDYPVALALYGRNGEIRVQDSPTRSAKGSFLVEWDTESNTGVPSVKPPTPTGGTPVPLSTSATATKDAPFVNTLGMKFVPVPIIGGPTGGQRVLFSVWETRVKDLETFAKETKNSKVIASIGNKARTDPTTGASWEDATAFCVWLTERERQAGKLGANERYRLPSDHEWSCAVGIGDREDPAQTPAEKSKKIENVFPWGSAWPPPAGAGNYAGSENAPAHLQGIKGFIEGYTDAFTHLSPPGSFPANGLGLHDLGGNLSELCEEWIDGAKRFRVTRGASWMSSIRNALGSSHRDSTDPTVSTRWIGFRVVLAPASP